MVFLGAAVGVRRGAHFRLHLLVDCFPPGVRRVADFVACVVMIAFSAVLFVQGWKLHGVRAVPANAGDGHLESLGLCGGAGRAAS